MAAASLDVNFGEELSAVERCAHIFSTHSIDLTFPQDSRLPPKLSAHWQPLYKVSCNIQSSADPLFHHRHATNGRPLGCSSEPGCRGFYVSQMEFKLASKTRKSPGLKTTCSPSARTFSPRTTSCHLLALNPSPSFLSPHTTDGVGKPSDAAATLPSSM